MKQTETTIKVLDKEFMVFEPVTANPRLSPVCGGNYIFALKEGRKLPENEQPCVMQRINFGRIELEVIYTGIGHDLFDRIMKTHFGKNAGRSTLRKSLGSLMGLEKINRDTKENGKTKFTDEGELKITEWMMQNLLVFVAENTDFEEDEQRFIDFLNPPLNLDKNHNLVNAEYRQMLSTLRCSRDVKRISKPAKEKIPTVCNQSSNKGLYIALWRSCLPKIKKILLDCQNSGAIFSLSLEDFTNCGGRRKDYSFRLEIQNSGTNNLGGSAVARDLFAVIREDKELWGYQKSNRLLIRMSKQFEVFVSKF